MQETTSHWINVRDKPGFLHHLMIALGERARISLEGELSKCRFADALVVACDEIGSLKRNTLWPKLNFIVLRLEPDTVAPIFQQALAAGFKRGLTHVQIEKDGVLQLGAYDNFHPECVVTGPAAPKSLLEDLQAKGIIRGFVAATPSA